MKKLILLLLTTLLCFVSVLGIGCGKSHKIVVGATPSPHAEILNSKVVQDYIKSKGYKLKVKVYQDYVTPNKALNDGGIDANYFQHIPYLDEEVANNGYDIKAACQVHNEPLNFYGKNALAVYENITVNIINDKSNVGRAFELLKAYGLIDSYDTTDFNAEHPVYTSSKNVIVKCIDAGLLHKKVEEDGYAIIPGNYALTAWSTETATGYKLFGETAEVAYPNIIACKTADLNSEKINVLIEALSLPELATYITETYGPTVSPCFKDLRA